MRFELPSTRLLEFTGSQTVPVKSCGAEKWSFAVTLAITVDGTKLSCKVIFKGIRHPRDDELYNEEAHEINDEEGNELETESEGESDGK